MKHAAMHAGFDQKEQWADQQAEVFVICGTDITNYLPAVTGYVHSPPLPPHHGRQSNPGLAGPSCRYDLVQRTRKEAVCRCQDKYAGMLGETDK